MFSLICLKKQKKPVLLFIRFPLMLTGSLKKFWRFKKQNLLKIIRAWSPVYFIVLILISYNRYVTNCTNILCSADVSISVNININGPSINIFYKKFNFSFYNSSRLPYEVRKYQKINLLASKGRSYSDNMYILPLLFLFLLFKIFLRKRKSDPRLKNYSY